MERHKDRCCTNFRESVNFLEVVVTYAMELIADEEGSGQRPPLLVRLVRGVVLTILRQAWGLLSGFAKFVRSRKSKW